MHRINKYKRVDLIFPGTKILKCAAPNIQDNKIISDLSALIIKISNG